VAVVARHERLRVLEADRRYLQVEIEEEVAVVLGHAAQIRGAEDLRRVQAPQHR